MKINKGKISNINKKLLAGGIALTLLTTSLAGCSSSRLKYERDEQGEYVCVNEATYNYLKDCIVLIFEKDSKILIYVVEEVGVNYHCGHYKYYKYINIFGGQEIYNTGNLEYNRLKPIREEAFINYLLEYDKVKNTYTEEELKEIIDMIKEDYQKENNKELVKEK